MIASLRQKRVSRPAGGELEIRSGISPPVAALESMI